MVVINSIDFVDDSAYQEITKRLCVRNPDCAACLDDVLILDRGEFLDEDSHSQTTKYLCNKRSGSLSSAAQGMMLNEFFDEDSYHDVRKRVKNSDCASPVNSNIVRLAIEKRPDSIKGHILVILGAHHANLWENVHIDVVWTSTEKEAAELLFRGHVDVACIGYEQVLQHWSCGWRSKVLCSPTCTNHSDDHLILDDHPVLFCSEAFEFLHPDVCLCIVRGIIRAARQLHNDPNFFLRVTNNPALSRSVVQFQEADLLELWQQFVAIGMFAVNGAISRTHWGPRLEEAANRGGVSYEEFVASAHVMAALRKLGRHPSQFDEI